MGAEDAQSEDRAVKLSHNRNLAAVLALWLLPRGRFVDDGVGGLLRRILRHLVPQRFLRGVACRVVSRMVARMRDRLLRHDFRRHFRQQ